MAQIPNLDNAPLNLTALRSAKPIHPFTTSFHSVVLLIILMYACREQSQKELLNILKSVGFFSPISITIFFTLVHSEESELFHCLSDSGEEVSGYRSKARGQSKDMIKEVEELAILE